MAILTSFVLCDAVMNIPSSPNSGNASLHLVDPIPVINPYAIPGNFSFTMVLGVCDIDNTEPHRCRIAIKSPTDKTVSDSFIDVPRLIDIPDQSKDETSGIFMYHGLRNVVFTESGIHTIDIRWDEGSLSTLRIPVLPKNSVQ